MFYFNSRAQKSSVCIHSCTRENFWIFTVKNVKSWEFEQFEIKKGIAMINRWWKVMTDSFDNLSSLNRCTSTYAFASLQTKLYLFFPKTYTLVLQETLMFTKLIDEVRGGLNCFWCTVYKNHRREVNKNLNCILGFFKLCEARGAHGRLKHLWSLQTHACLVHWRRNCLWCLHHLCKVLERLPMSFEVSLGS